MPIEQMRPDTNTESQVINIPEEIKDVVEELRDEFGDDHKLLQRHINRAIRLHMDGVSCDNIFDQIVKEEGRGPVDLLPKNKNKNLVAEPKESTPQVENQNNETLEETFVELERIYGNNPQEFKRIKRRAEHLYDNGIPIEDIVEQINKETKTATKYTGEQKLKIDDTGNVTIAK